MATTPTPKNDEFERDNAEKLDTDDKLEHEKFVFTPDNYHSLDHLKGCEYNQMKMISDFQKYNLLFAK